MSKNKYSLPFCNCWYVEFGGVSKKNSHSYEIINQRYAYDFEIRDRYNLPYFDDYLKCESYYCYGKNIIAPCAGYVVDIVNRYENTQIRPGRPIVCDHKAVHGNYIILKHEYGEYSVICHILKDSFCVKEGDFVKQGDLLAQVGNSGNTQGPHLHFHVQNGLDEKSKGIKITFENVEVLSTPFFHKRKYIQKGQFVQNKNH